MFAKINYNYFNVKRLIIKTKVFDRKKKTLKKFAIKKNFKICAKIKLTTKNT